MFNIGTGEFILIAVLALLILGPTRLPEFARGIGKFIREFRRQTDDVRNVVEREFYRMDEQVRAMPEPTIQPAEGALPHGENGELTQAEGLEATHLDALPIAEPTHHDALEQITDPSAPLPEEPAVDPVTAEMPTVTPAAPQKKD